MIIGDAEDTPEIRKLAVKKPTQCITQVQIRDHNEQCSIRSSVERLNQAFVVFSEIYKYDHQNFDVDFDNAVLLRMN
ncbi:hypothetical protein A3Q56_01897 [Intoshia linei]|uniref:Uncharacterized protein n=1 Tax=Intoshia linei TaxID=1819745 RepID=A0A177B801_9BILA|nr:hypothetical protein A3Q56_01897 [Intoshia linei]